ncbi:hypothetical protein DL763_006564 [Monosporascus cannonballus]|nr:hypothetical protein DL763_006564 [Monosporascus cannonballus]
MGGLHQEVPHPFWLAYSAKVPVTWGDKASAIRSWPPRYGWAPTPGRANPLLSRQRSLPGSVRYGRYSYHYFPTANNSAAFFRHTSHWAYIPSLDVVGHVRAVPLRQGDDTEAARVSKIQLLGQGVQDGKGFAPSICLMGLAKFLCNGGKCREIKNAAKDVASHICKKHPPEGKTSAYQRFLENAASAVRRCDKCEEAFPKASKLDGHIIIFLSTAPLLSLRFSCNPGVAAANQGTKGKLQLPESESVRSLPRKNHWYAI